MADAPIGGDVGDIDADVELLESDVTDDTPDEEEDDLEEETPPAPRERTPKPPAKPTPPAPKAEEDEDEEEEEEEEEDEDEDEDEEDKEKDKPKPTQHPMGGRRLSVKEIEGKFPKLFSEYPELKDSFFRDAKFRRAFATPEEATQAREAVDYYDELANSLDKGDSSLFIAGLRDRDPKTLQAFAKDFLPKLAQVSPTLVVNAVKPHFTSLLRNAFKDAERTGNKNLLNSVGHIAKYAEIDLQAQAAKPGEVSDRERQLAEQNQTLQGREAQRFVGTVTNAGTTQLTREVVAHLNKYKDFSPIELGTIANGIVNEIGSRLDRNDLHDKTMNKLFERANRAGWPEEMVSRIIDAYLGGGRPLIDTVLKKHVAAAMKVKGIRPKGSGEPGTGRVRDVERGVGGGAPRVRAAGLSSRDVDYSKTSDMDILNDRVAPRKRA